MEKAKVFVYGSLRMGCTNDITEKNEISVKFITNGKIKADLFEIEDYPITPKLKHLENQKEITSINKIKANLTY